MIGCVAATVYQPVKDLFHASPQLRKFLTPPPVDGSLIIRTADPLLRVLVSDMGTFPRAIEALQDALIKQGLLVTQGDANHVSASSSASASANQIPPPLSRTYSTVGDDRPSLKALASAIRDALKSKYPHFTELAGVLRPVLRCALGQRRFDGPTDLVPGLGADWTVERVCSFGLVKLSSQGTLHMPYILLWLLAGEATADPLLQEFELCDYHEHMHRHNKSLSPGLTVWQNFEHFGARFRRLRSILYDGQRMSLSEFHGGARFHPSLDPSTVYMHIVAATSVVSASNQLSSKSSDRATLIRHEKGTTDIKDGRTVVVNGTSAPAADVFLCQSFDRECLPAHRTSLRIRVLSL